MEEGPGRGFSKTEGISMARRTGAFPVQLQLLWAPRVGAERWTLEAAVESGAQGPSGPDLEPRW